MAPMRHGAARCEAARPGTRHARGRRAEKAGRAAEALCARVLEAAGFTILAHRLRTGAGEIDLLARRDGLVVFVEVKARMSAADGAEAVGPAQRRRLVAAAEIVLAERPELAGCDCRFDVMVALPEGAPIWLEGAFRADD